VPSSARTTSGRRRLTPAVSSHAVVQPDSSRPLAASSSTSRSARRVLPHACLAKYDVSPSRNSFSPTHATSWRSDAAPCAYVMPSKFTSTASRSTMSAAMGCVEDSCAWRYAQPLRWMRNVVHASR